MTDINEEYDKEYVAAVDIPKLDYTGKISDEWTNVEMFFSKEDAIKWAMENLGADSEGRISVISTF